MAMVLRKPIVIALLFLGFAFLVFQLWQPQNEGVWAWALLAMILAIVPPIQKVLGLMLQRIENPSPRARFRAALIIWALTSVYLIATAQFQGRVLFPRSHDEQMHFVQMQMMAHGRLWMPFHPLADFFETFFIITRPVYAAIYFPGTSLLYLPTIWLHLPNWLMPVCVSGALAAVLYRLVSELIDGIAGALATLMLVSLRPYRMLATGVMSHPVLALQGLMLILLWLRWRERPTLKRAALIGALGGWMAITRPLDAIAFALPVGVAMLVTLLKQPPRRLLATLLIIVACAVPFLSLQAVLNWGTTGSVLRTPYQAYLAADLPNSSYGFHEPDPDARPQSTLPQKYIYYKYFLLPGVLKHTPANVIRELCTYRLPILLNLSLPSPLLLVLIPLAIAGLTTVPRIVLFVVLPLWILLFVPNPQMLEHYVIVVAPIIIYSVCLGAWSLWQTWLGKRVDVRTTLFVGITTLALGCLPEFNPDARDELLETPVLRALHGELQKVIEKPAVVLIHFTPGDHVHEEPVYNIQAPWPDDAAVIYAHDLGPRRNNEIFRYYADRQPGRKFYLLDRATVKTSPKITYLGTAQELAKQ